jgi:hypothetical protein
MGITAGVVIPVDMQLIEDQLERFIDSSGHMLHAKIVGDTRDGVVALASKKSPADIVRHVGNLRKSSAEQTAAAKAAIHAVGKSAVVAKPHPAVEPPAAIAKPAAAKPHLAVEPPAVAITTNDVGAIEISTVNLLAIFDDYTA